MNDLVNLKIFSETVINFFDELSMKILKDSYAREFPDLITFAFHIRKANISNIRDRYFDIEKLACGRGLAYHIGPSNVPMNFAFSIFYSLLAGNATIARLPSIDFPQVSLLISHINRILDNKIHQKISAYISLIKFDKNSDLSQHISKLSMVRVIWGSDETVATVLKYQKKIKCKDLVFPSRVSWAIVSCHKVLDKKTDLNKLAHNFFNDTFSMDQNACSSPTQIFFLRDTNHTKKAKNIFWEAVHEIMISQKYELNGAMIMNREVASIDAIITKAHGWIDRQFLPYFHRVEIDINAKDVMQFNVGGGLFFETEIDNLKCLDNYLSEQVQTITTHKENVQKVRKILNETCPGQVDRVVPFGQALDFGPVWDGYDLIREMSQQKI